jgi:Lytic transglycolase
MSVTRLHAVAVGAVLALAGALAVGVVIAGPPAGAASIPIGRPMTGSMTYYNDIGYGACGTPINAATENLVAVSYQWWTTANPNNDPICQGISVQVTYNGKTITVPVKDKCPSCNSTHIDLSQLAFQQLAPLSVGVVNGITWRFVGSSGGGEGGGAPPPSACGAAWNASTSYVPGDVVSYGGHEYAAINYSTGAVPSAPSSWAVWQDNGACS